MSFTEDQIIDHYRSEAEKHGMDGTSTIQDIRTRRLEIAAIFSYIRDGERILEVGCGNGYVAQVIVENFAVELDAIDFSPEMIALAKKRGIAQAKGRVSFTRQNILELNAVDCYDLVFAERCLQNLVSWDDQKMALENIARALSDRGQFVMLESFWSGLNRLNQARKELDLPEIPPPWHNLLFEEEEVKALMISLGCSYIDQNCFLSGYYFGSRVLLPALLPKGKPVTSQSVLNDYFYGLPPLGDFSPIKILRFRKNEQ
jgi:SAM-dependent methyltransferase